MTTFGPIPAVYTPPFGVPLHWRNEQSGQLPAAMLAYFQHAGDSSKPAPSEEQLQLVIHFFHYFISAPCWQGAEISELREEAAQMQTVQGVAAWLDKCLDAGIDPA
jgi:hypothetical protein